MFDYEIQALFAFSYSLHWTQSDAINIFFLQHTLPF